MKKIVTLTLAVSLVCGFVFAGELPKVGDRAPELNLKNQDEETISLDDLNGNWVVLYFYPKDFTGGCTLEAHNFQRDLAMYEEKNALVIGVSVDSTDSHASFCEKESLEFDLLSDSEARVSRSYNSVMESQGNLLSARNTFIIDPEGKIARVFEAVKPAGHSKEVLAALADLQTEE